MTDNSQNQPYEQDTFNQESADTLTPGNETKETDEEKERLVQELQEMKEKYLRQVAEFDNYRKRTAREKLELMQTAGKDVIGSLLVVLDDMERAEKQLQQTNENDPAREGLILVFNKLKSVLSSKGLKPMDAIGKDFDPDQHEAISEIPAPSRDLAGKVIDEVEKGYFLNDKIIRFAKVVVGK